MLRRFCRAVNSAPPAAPFSGRTLRAVDRAPPAGSAAQLTAGRLLDFSHQTLREGFDFAIGQAALLRLQNDSDREGLFTLRQTRPFIDVKQPDLRGELAMDPPCGSQQPLSRQLLVDDKGEIALDRLEYRQFQRRLGAH